MVKICYMLAILCEMSLGIIFSLRIYPEFRIENKLMRSLAVILFCISGAMYAWNSWMFYVSTFFVVVISFQIALLYWLFWRSNFLEVLLLEIFYFTNISILKMPLVTMHGLLENRTFYEVNIDAKVYSDVIYILLIVFMVGILMYKYKILETIIKRMLFKNKIIFLSIIVVEWLMLAYGMRMGKWGIYPKNLFINMLCIVCISAVIIYMALFYTYQQIRNDRISQQAIYDNLKKQYLGLQRIYDLNNQQMHNIKHELIYICNCLEENKISCAYESSKKYLKKFNLIERKIWTGYSSFDFVLNYKKAEIDRKRINFSLDIDIHQIEIPEDDLMIILGNLLDNAMEAAEKCENKYIKLKSRNINNMLLLKIENSSTQLPQVKNGVFISNKKNKNEHGFGIESVKRIVDEHEGEIHFQYSENYFQVEILI